MHKIKKLSGPVFAIIAGIFIIRISLGKKEAPKEEALQSKPVKVQTKRLSKQRWSPKLTVYGTVHPHDFYQAVAEVSGRISWIHPQFQGVQFSLKKRHF